MIFTVSVRNVLKINVLHGLCSNGSFIFFLFFPTQFEDKLKCILKMFYRAFLSFACASVHVD